MERAAFALLLILGCASADAAPITYDFTGPVSFIVLDATPLPLPPDLMDFNQLLASTFSGSVTVENELTDALPDVTEGYYFGAVLDFTASLAGHPFHFETPADPFDPVRFSDGYVTNDFGNPAPADSVTLRAATGPGSLTGPYSNYYAELTLGSFSTDTSALASDGIPSDLTALPDWLFLLSIYDPDTFAVQQMVGPVTLTKHVAAVPEPRPGLLLAVGLGLLAVATVRRRRTPAGQVSTSSRSLAST